MLRPHTLADVQALAELVLEAEGFRFKLGVPTITVSNRQTSRRLGSSWTWQNRIVIYWRLMEYWNATAIEDLIRHELAHILAYQAYDYDQTHGPGWIKACAALGALPHAEADQYDRLAFVAKSKEVK